MNPTYFFRLVVCFALALLPAKFYLVGGVAGPLLMQTLVSWLQDTVLLVLVYLIFSRVNQIIGQILAAIVFLTSLLYSTHLSDLIQYPINIFRADVGLAQFFFTYFVDVGDLVLVVLITLAVFAVARYFPKVTNRKIVVSITGVLFLLFLITLGRPPINPVAFSIYDEIKNIGSPSPYAGKIVRLNQTDAGSYTVGEFAFLDKSLPEITKQNFKYKKVLLLVMETVDRDMYYQDPTTAQSFWQTSDKLQCERYENYYATNLDSYPSLYVMLYSRLYPYKAYGSKVESESLERGANNLVDFFNFNNFSTHFISPYDENPWIPNRTGWKEVKERKDFNETGFTCLNTTRIDSACEDNIAIDYIIDSLKQNDKALVMHEMVYGHIAKWQQTTGIGQIDYYNRFFNEIYTRLEKEKLLDDTLIVVLGDHGSRINSMKIENYRVPLVICGSQVKPAVNQDLLSHLDFKDLLLNELTANWPVKASNHFFLVGSSNQWVYGEVTPENYTLINDNTLAVVTTATEQAVINLNQTFQRYLGYIKDQTTP